MAQQTPKHEKLLAMAATAYGAPNEIYLREASGLKAAGLIEAREVFTTGGNRKLRLFLCGVAA